MRGFMGLLLLGACSSAFAQDQCGTYELTGRILHVAPGAVELHVESGSKGERSVRVFGLDYAQVERLEGTWVTVQGEVGALHLGQVERVEKARITALKPSQQKIRSQNRRLIQSKPCEKTRGDLMDQNEPPKNCVVTVTQHLKTGKSETHTYRYNAKDEAHCKKLARAHEENMAPDQVVKKTVKVKWSKAAAI